MDKDNFNRFFDRYVIELDRCMREYPEDYGLQSQGPIGDELCARTANNMRAGFQRKTYNKDGRAIRATCKALGIGTTYKAINEFLGHDGPMFGTSQ